MSSTDAAGSTFPGIGAPAFASGESITSSPVWGQAATAPDEPAASAGPTVPVSILVVDDEPAIERLYTQRFRREILAGQWSFQFASNGLEALEKLRQNPDILVVLVDINMPVMDGLTFLGELKKLNLPTQAVVVSAYGDMQNIRTAMNQGAFDFLCKPIDFQDVEVTIRKSLEYANYVRESRRAAEYRLAKEAAEQNYQRLKELEDLRDCLVHMVVHDLRTPMTSYIGGLQVMEMWGGLSPAQQQCLQTSLRGGATLIGMINDLLDISKMEAGMLELHYKDLLVERASQLALQQVAPLAEQCNLTVKTDIAPNLPPVQADEEKLQRILVNLLSNSIKFTPEDGEIVLSARLNDDRDAIVVGVADTGRGIPADQRDLIFEKYGQAEGFKKERRMMSSGLGLTFCKMVTEAHGGEIWVESEEGKGSQFYFTIPLPSEDTPR